MRFVLGGRSVRRSEGLAGGAGVSVGDDIRLRVVLQELVEGLHRVGPAPQVPGTEGAEVEGLWAARVARVAVDDAPP